MALNRCTVTGADGEHGVRVCHQTSTRTTQSLVPKGTTSADTDTSAFNQDNEPEEDERIPEGYSKEDFEPRIDSEGRFHFSEAYKAFMREAFDTLTTILSDPDGVEINFWREAVEPAVLAILESGEKLEEDEKESL